MYMLINALLVTAIYVFISAPAFTTQVLYRRYEKANLIGPAEILGIFERDFSSYDRLLLADTGDGVVIFAESMHTQDTPQLIYRNKRGPLTVLAAPDPTPFNSDSYEARVNILAFDNHPEAVSAQLELTLFSQYLGEKFSQTYTVDAQRQIPGVFCFDLHIMRLSHIGAEGYAVEVLKMISDYCGSNFYGTEFPATVSFYDGQGNLICRESTVVSSPATQAAP